MSSGVHPSPSTASTCRTRKTRRPRAAPLGRRVRPAGDAVWRRWHCRGGGVARNGAAAVPNRLASPPYHVAGGGDQPDAGIGDARPPRRREREETGAPNLCAGAHEHVDEVGAAALCERVQRRHALLVVPRLRGSGRACARAAAVEPPRG
jgi:hypothetical protein